MPIKSDLAREKTSLQLHHLTSNGRIINFCAVVNKDFVGIYVLNFINQTEILIN